jgi:hypothetical protein
MVGKIVLSTGLPQCPMDLRCTTLHVIPLLGGTGQSAVEGLSWGYRGSDSPPPCCAEQPGGWWWRRPQTTQVSSSWGGGISTTLVSPDEVRFRTLSRGPLQSEHTGDFKAQVQMQEKQN